MVAGTSPAQNTWSPSAPSGLRQRRPEPRDLGSRYLIVLGPYQRA